MVMMLRFNGPCDGDVELLASVCGGSGCRPAIAGNNARACFIAVTSPPPPPTLSLPVLVSFLFFIQCLRTRETREKRAYRLKDFFKLFF
jgi:hypothetical protein